MTDTEKDSDFGEQFGNHLRAMKAAFEGKCPEAEMLSRYLEGDLAGDEIPLLEAHLDGCPICLEVVQRLSQVEAKGGRAALPEDWTEIEKAMDARVYAALDALAPPEPARAHRRTPASGFWAGAKSTLDNLLLLNRVPRFAPGILALSLCLGALTTYALISRPPYFSLSQIEFEQTGIVRGEGSASGWLAAGLNAFDDRDYEQAIQALGAYLEEDPNHCQANFYLGLAHLFEAKETLLGVSYRFDSGRVKAGLSYLQKALSLSEDNLFYQEECLWYLGKGYMMLGDLQAARERFEQLAALDAPNLLRKEDAKEILQRLGQHLRSEML
ncbi:MAG: tetratricopeptide repeat protein [bacterium]